MPRIIAYTYDCGVHCPACAGTDAAVGILRRDPPLSLDVDEHGLAYDLIDREGSPVRPVFSAYVYAFDTCSDCGAPLLSLQSQFKPRAESARDFRRET